MNNLELNQIKIDGATEKLVSSMENLRDRLNQELEMIKLHKEKRSGTEYQPNSLGIVQDKGCEIDNICGRLGGLYEMKEILDGTSKLFNK